MQEMYDESSFLVQFPLWMVLDEVNLSRGLIRVNGGAGQVGFPVFTDKDLAERFLNQAPKTGQFTLGAADRDSLSWLLGLLEANGFTDVAFDATTAQARFVPLGQIRAAISNR